MVPESINGKMVGSTLDNGRMEKCTEKENYNGLMVRLFHFKLSKGDSMMENTPRIKNMASGYFSWQMVVNSKAIGKKDCRMGKENSLKMAW